MSGSFARGDQPRTVLDPDEKAYAEMIRWQRAYNARQEAREGQRARAATAPVASAGHRPATEDDYWSSHPGFAESMIPVWGSAREAVADAREGDVLGAVGNGVLALTDLAPGGYAAKGLAKGGLKLTGSHTWNATRKFMGKREMLAPNQHGHHGIIPQGGWGSHVPDFIKNQPPNIKAMPSPEVDGRIHGPYDGKPRYSPVERYWRGTPDWAKAVQSWVPSGLVTAADASHEK